MKVTRHRVPQPHSVPQMSEHLRGYAQTEVSVQTEGKYTELQAVFLGTPCHPAVWVDGSVLDGTHPVILLNTNERRQSIRKSACCYDILGAGW